MVVGSIMTTGVRTIQAFDERSRAPESDLGYVLLHHAGGASSAYLDWASQLGQTGQVLTPDLPGRRLRLREPFHSTLEEAVSDILRKLHAKGLPRRVVLLGHSMGALLAYELAFQVTRIGGCNVEGIVVSGSRPPQLYEREPWWLGLDDIELATASRDWGAAEAPFSSAAIGRRMQTLRADLALCASYRFTPRRRLTCPVLALSGSADPIAPPSVVDGWREYTRGTFRSTTFDGSHFFIFRPEVIAQAAPLIEELARTSNRHGGRSR